MQSKKKQNFALNPIDKPSNSQQTERYPKYKQLLSIPLI